jgi:hypothetical protein
MDRYLALYLAVEEYKQTYLLTGGIEVKTPKQRLLILKRLARKHTKENQKGKLVSPLAKVYGVG